MTTSLFERNEAWRQAQLAADPDCFKRLAQGQSPDYYAFCCEDSRMDLDKVMQADPGTFFTHRSVGNIVDVESDEFKVGLTYALTVLKIPNIVVCGHSHCGGMHESLKPHSGNAVFDSYLAGARKTREGLEVAGDWHDKVETEQARALAEANVYAQIKAIRESVIYQNLLAAPGVKAPRFHAWVFEFESGRVIDLGMPNG